MTTSTSDEKHGIQWTAWMQLDDSDFADDLGLLSHTHEQMQVKTKRVVAASSSVGLNIHKINNKILKHNTENTNSITLARETLEEVEKFTYLDSIINEQGGFDVDVKLRIGKARTAFLQLSNICNSKPLSTNIKVRIFSMNVKTVLLCAAETWRIQLSTHDTQYTFPGYHQQHHSVGEKKPTSR
ncbi:unnamed protein product [Schistosoma curassoni]|uniref:DUF6451 domain-containing protein n=1 Tax=Schistosoma curassoni TaxID=6186 RepID=A0A183K7K1_9TREM|nr:unnamed protein product [Schistosoma curassoni]